MITLRLIKAVGRSPSRLALLLIPLVFACFASAQSAQAAENAAMAQADNDPTPNNRKIIINSIPFIPCAGEEVDLRGFVHIKFGVREFFGERSFGPMTFDLEQFSGRGKMTGRKYVASNKMEPFGKPNTPKPVNGKGHGDFKLRILVTGNPNPPPQAEANPRNVVKFKLLYSVHYRYEFIQKTGKKEVTFFKFTRDNICCPGSACF